jgi:hypothetical protein
MSSAHLPSCLFSALVCLGLAGCTTSQPSSSPADAGQAVPAGPPRQTSWQDVNVTAATHGPLALLVPMPYVKHDGVPAILFRAPREGGKHGIYEFSNPDGGWKMLELCGAASPDCAPSGPVFGYARADGTSSVVYTSQTAKERHLREIAWDNGPKNWHEWDLTLVAKAGAIDGAPVAYTRGDKANAVIYCQHNGEIRETGYGAQGWRDTSLTQGVAGAEPANCDLCQPYPLATPDGQSLVFYLGLDSHIHALHLKGTAWVHHDLTTESRAKVNGYPCPTAYQRADGVVSVLYKVPANGGFRLHEITGMRNQADFNWGDWDFFASVNPPPPPMQACQGAFCNPGEAYGLVSDNASRVYYVSVAGKIEEISLTSGGWKLSAPSPSNAGCTEPVSYPRAYLRKDGTPAVVYLDPTGAVHELRKY